MVRLFIVVLVLVAVTVLSPGVLAQSPESTVNKPCFDSFPSTCIRQIPESVLTALNQEIAARIKKAPLSLETTIALKSAIMALDEKAPGVSAEHRRAITDGGANSIPVIAEMLLSQDEKTRDNAVLALGYIHPLSNSGVTETPGNQNLRIMLLRVGILDKSPTVRRSAIRYLARIGYGNPRTIPEGVIAGIDSALDDPDRRIRRIAETEKEALMLAAQDAQTRPEEGSGSGVLSGSSLAGAR